MNFRHLLFAICASFLMTGCWIGDQDDPEILYDTTLIEALCQNPDLSTFCKMIYLSSPVTTGNSAGLVPEIAWVLQFSTRSGNPPGLASSACPINVETVFAPTDSAWTVFLADDDYAHWGGSIYNIPQDTVEMLIKHHIYIGGKLVRPNDPLECSSVPILLGSQGMPMWIGRWVFVRNAEGDVRAQSVQSGRFLGENIETPDFSSTDGGVYIINTVLGPF